MSSKMRTSKGQFNLVKSTRTLSRWDRVREQQPVDWGIKLKEGYSESRLKQLFKEVCSWHKLYQYFLRSVSERNKNKSKKTNGTKSNLQAFPQQRKPQTKQKYNLWTGKNIFKWSNWQRLNFQNIQKGHMIQKQK